MNTFITLILLWSLHLTFGQDTLEIKDRTDFNNVIWESFIEQNGNTIDPVHKASIDSIYRAFDFGDTIHICNYQFTFIMELDSCGTIIKCKPNWNNNYGGKIGEFQAELTHWFLSFAPPIRNYCLTGTEHHFQMGVSIQFEVSCESGAILYWKDNTAINQGTVFMYQTNTGPTYFNGFSTFCKGK